MTNEKTTVPPNGYLMLFVFLILFFGSIFAIIAIRNPWFGVLLALALFLLPGFVLVYPNDSRVLILFGKYVGTIKQNGFYWVNPFYVKKKISLRA
ncbi:MAG: SPFH domain-containing protein, partial [Sinomicrobium sp.]|nr:SPFH domain-containing protein [Sinomicrobium sp.]